MDNLICASCGSSVSADAKFCLSCGADLERARKEAEKPKNLCSECGAELAQGQLFCHLCGKKREQSCEAACEKPVSVKRTALGWIRRSLTLLMSILFIALAFLPIVSYRTTIDDEKVGFSFSAIDSIVFCFDSMRELDEEDIVDSRLYERVMDLTEMGDVEEETDKFVKLVVRLVLQSDNEPLRPQYIVSALVSLLYLLLAVAFFAVCLVDFIFFALGKGKDKLARTILIMLAAIPPLSLFASLCHTASYGVIPSLGGVMPACTMTMGGAIITLVVVSVAILIYLAVEKYFLSENKPGASAWAIVKRSLSAVACLLMMLSVVFPMVNYRVKTNFAESQKETRETRALGVSYFGYFLLDESEVEALEGWNEEENYAKLEEEASWYSTFSRSEFRNGEACYIDSDMLIMGFCGFGGAKGGVLISLVTVFAILASLLGAVLLWQNLAAIVSDSSPSAALTIPTKILGVLFAAAVLAIVIVFVCVASFNLKPIATARIAVGISAGAILMPVFAILASVVPMGKKKEK